MGGCRVPRLHGLNCGAAELVSRTVAPVCAWDRGRGPSQHRPRTVWDRLCVGYLDGPLNDSQGGQRRRSGPVRVSVDAPRICRHRLSVRSRDSARPASGAPRPPRDYGAAVGPRHYAQSDAVRRWGLNGARIDARPRARGGRPELEQSHRRDARSALRAGRGPGTRSWVTERSQCSAYPTCGWGPGVHGAYGSGALLAAVARTMRARFREP